MAVVLRLTLVLVVGVVVVLVVGVDETMVMVMIIITTLLATNTRHALLVVAFIFCKLILLSIWCRGNICVQAGVAPLDKVCLTGREREGRGKARVSSEEMSSRATSCLIDRH